VTGGLVRRLGAEALGTALLVAAVIGSGIMAEALAGGNSAVALLGNTLATAAMLVVLITMFGPVSGAHFNPAVTLAFALRREVRAAEALAYAGVQLAGGLAGAALAHAMFGLPLLMEGAQVRTGPGQWLGEGVATCALVLAILGTLRWRPGWMPLTVASAIAAGYWFTSSTSFANPAVTLARAFTDSFSGIRLVDVPGFAAAQLAGAVLGLALARWLFTPGASLPARERPARTQTVIDSPR
jgi:glycerol uptake facilitator-like aquaporin